MANQASKIAAAAGYIATISSPANYNFDYRFAPSTAPRVAEPIQSQSAGGPMMLTEGHMNAKFEAAEARTETKFAQLLGKLDLLVQGVGDLRGDVTKLEGKIDSVDGHARTGKREIIIAIATTGIAVVALAWAGVQIFQGGLSLTQGAFQAGMSAQQVNSSDQPTPSPRKR